MDSLQQPKRRKGLGLLALGIVGAVLGLLLFSSALAGIIPPSTGAASPVNDGQRPSVRAITPSTQVAPALGSAVTPFINGVVEPSISTVTPSSEDILPTSATVSPEVETATTSTDSVVPSMFEVTPTRIGVPATISPPEPVVPSPFDVTPLVAGPPAAISAPQPAVPSPLEVTPLVTGVPAAISSQTVDPSAFAAEGSSSTGSSPSSGTVTPSTMAAPPASQGATPYENGVMQPRSQPQEPVFQARPPSSAHAPLFMNFVVPVQIPVVVRIGSGEVAPGGYLTVPLEALDVPPPGLGAFTVDVTYNPSVVNATGCTADPGGIFDTASCDIAHGPNTIRVTGTRASAGATANLLLAEITFQGVGQTDQCSVLDVAVVIFTDSDDNPILVTDQDGQICISLTLGDVDCDDDVDAVDALFILQYVVGSRLASDQCPPLEGHLYLPAGDVDRDEDVDAVDALFVLQCVVGIPNVLCPAS